MELLDFYPSPEDFIRNELKVLDYLATSTYIAQEHPQFCADAIKYRAQYQGRHADFQFASYFNVYHKEMPRFKRRTPNLHLIVAGLIEQKTKSKYGNISYLLAVGRIRSLIDGEDGRNLKAGNRTYPSLLRKFHFDVTTNTANLQRRKQAHPMCHLQYCGKMIPLMGELGFRQSQFEQMHVRLSEPRIFFWPMSLALLIDMALHEFPDSESAQFRQKPEWKNIIRANETFLLKPFYEKCVSIIRSVKKQRDTLADEFDVI